LLAFIYAPQVPRRISPKSQGLGLNPWDEREWVFFESRKKVNANVRHGGGLFVAKKKMKMNNPVRPRIVSRDKWLTARKKLLAKEKQLTHQRDALNTERRELPWVKVEKDYVFDGPNGKQTLAELFQGRNQLVVYKDQTGEIFHTYSSYARGTETVLGTYSYLDLVPKGRDEDDLAFTMSWVRHHDRYDDGYLADPGRPYWPADSFSGSSD
jgi:Bacterial protein of unknown function (DUF899)